ncbi:MAG: prephenate dehydrogenase/arogenate dehydrogenase family protein [Ardenticatenia bacterium]|nr:prephenate dehydrogenase/arogenate dehydrogenase family protein [Ardenticatenia bacterium]MBL7063190.1 prephenate dehydrogenase/arogenate dehydrogenase family protein [Anaerolineae bacterium]
MDFKRVAIIGTDYISVSIALGLKAQKEPPEVTGYDASAVAADLARTRGAFDRVERKPGRACRDADLVIVAVPLTQLRDTLATIAPHLQPGCLVTDTAYLKAPVMRWAEELLPEGVFFVGGHPVPSPATAGLEPSQGLDAASADLLKNALYCLIAPARTSGAMIDAFAGLVKSLQAHPFFIDVTEHDGLQAGVEGLPDLLAIALLRATVDTSGWLEMYKFTDHRFATATEAAEDARERHTAIFLNRENILLRLNALLSELVRLRDLLTHDDAEGLEKTFVAAAEGRDRWIAEREQGTWGREGAAGTKHVPTAGEQMGQMFFGGRLFARLKGKPDPHRE